MEDSHTFSHMLTFIILGGILYMTVCLAIGGI